MPKPKILVIEDERALVEVLTYNLEREGFEVLTAFDGQEGLRQAQLKLPDLIVLDLMLPLKPGLEVCRELRMGPRTRDIPIVMVTAKAEESDELVGFATGADDYVTKPYSMKVLIQRIKKELRRTQSQEEAPAGTVIGSQGVVIDRHSHRALYRDQELPLTPTEFRLLEVAGPPDRTGVHALRADGRGHRRGCDRPRTDDRRAHQESAEEARRGRRAHRDRPRRRLSVS